MYDRNKYFSLCERVYNDNKYFYYIRRYIIHESIYRIIQEDV